MKLTEEEKELILAKREKEDANKPKKAGYLKHDLYRYIGEFGDGDIGWLHTYETMNEEIQSFKESFELSLSAGAKFDCYIDNGEESWYDAVNGTVEAANANWARKHLRDIEDVKRKKVNKRKV